MSPWRWAAWLSVAAVACTHNSKAPEPTVPGPVAPAACAARMQGVQVQVEDTVRGARVLYTVTDQRALDLVRTDVQARARPTTARAAGGAPIGNRTLPPVHVQTQILPNGQAVTYTAGDDFDALGVRHLVKQDVERQRKGECSSLRIPMVTRFGMAARRPLALTDIGLDAQLVSDCKLQQAHAQATVDTTELGRGRHPVLDRVIGCLTTGAMPGSRLEIVGRTPLVGPDEYELVFGRTRADSVAEYLGLGGLEPRRIEVTSAQSRAPGGADVASVEVRLSR